MRFLLLTLLLLTLSFALFGQTPSSSDQPIVRKFDEFVFTYENYKERATRFAEALSKEPNAKAYVISYNKRVYYAGSLHAGYALYYLENELLYGSINKVDKSRIVVLKGGLRENLDVEFFIVPKGALPPAATPAFQTADGIDCPQVGAGSQYFIFNTNSPIAFSANVNNGNSKVQPTYKWTVSTGRIIGGQGTSSIRVERPEGAYQIIKAAVDIEGFPKECSIKRQTAESRPEASELPLQIDGFGALQCDDELARLDQLAIGLQDDELVQGYIINYGGKRGRVNEAKARAAKMKAYLVQNRGIASNRITTIDGGFQEGAAGELWLTLKGQPAPLPQPTLERKDVKLIGTAKIINRSCGYGIY